MNPGKSRQTTRRKYPKNKNVTLLKIALVVIFALLSLFKLPSLFGGFSFYAFDVGQADAFLFRLPGGENVLVDTGTLNNTVPHPDATTLLIPVPKVQCSV